VLKYKISQGIRLRYSILFLLIFGFHRL